VPIAVDFADFARLTSTEYSSFVSAYGADVTGEPAFRLYADVQELRWLCFALSKAAVSKAAAAEAQHRIACLRGDVPRPWRWTAL
jgi:hypothetical protein